jgi:hypothetical protein
MLLYGVSLPPARTGLFDLGIAAELVDMLKAGSDAPLAQSHRDEEWR